VLPYAPAQAERIIERLCALAELDVAQARNDPERAERVRQAFGFIIDAARARQALLDLQAIESSLGRPPWRDLVKALRHDGGRFGAAIGDRSARIALRWALGDLGLAARASRRWRLSARQPCDAAQGDRPGAGGSAAATRCRPHRAADRVVLVEGVAQAYHLLTGKALGRSLTAEGTPTGPGVRLVRLCLEPLDPLLTADALVWAIRRAQDPPR
jgi:hypothetical protein